MKLKDLVQMDVSEFKKEFFEKEVVYFLENAFDLSIFPIEKLEEFVKNKENYKYLKKISDGQYVPVIPEYAKLDEFYQELQPLSGEALWDRLCQKTYSIHVMNFQDIFPAIKELSLDIYKNFNYGCQNYIVISKQLSHSSFKHHVDPMDLFAVQIKGEKYWQVAVDEDGRALSNRVNNLPYNPYDPEQLSKVKFKNFTLKAGSIAFLPFRAPHYVVMTESQETSIHFVVALTRYFYKQIKDRFMEVLATFLDAREPFETYEFTEDDYGKIISDLEIKFGEFNQRFDFDEFKDKLKKDQLNYDIKRTLRG